MPKTIFSGAHQELVGILIELRRSAGVTQVELARRIGKDQSVVSLIEGAHRRVDVVEFCTICRALDADPMLVLQRFVERLPDASREAETAISDSM